jgi:HD-GYP domain-containing protein (c-di-GMP phosphodiesterase class II)
MAIPDEILLKPGSLTPEERLLIEEHPQQAVSLLEGIPFLEKSLEIPCCHHERWDGSGYPHGWAGKEIPLAARIFAVIDVWDALTSNRPYRPAWTDDEAFDYILENEGILFDPKCVQAFIQVIEQSETNQQ